MRKPFIGITIAAPVSTAKKIKEAANIKMKGKVSPWCALVLEAAADRVLKAEKKKAASAV